MMNRQDAQCGPVNPAESVCVMGKMNWIATSDQGNGGQPGSGYDKKFAGVIKIKTGFELHVRDVWGSNQGYLEEHGRTERKYRAATIDAVMRVGIAEIRQESDDVFDSATKSALVAAIRETCFAAQDKAEAAERISE